MENVGGSSIGVLECVLSGNEIAGLPDITENICSVRERLQRLQQDNGELFRYLLTVNLLVGQVALTRGAFSHFAPGLYLWLSPAPMEIIVQLIAEPLTALFARMHRAKRPPIAIRVVAPCAGCRSGKGGRSPTDVIRPRQGQTLERAPRDGHANFFHFGNPSFRIGLPSDRLSPRLRAWP